MVNESMIKCRVCGWHFFKSGVCAVCKVEKVNKGGKDGQRK